MNPTRPEPWTASGSILGTGIAAKAFAPEMSGAARPWLIASTVLLTAGIALCRAAGCVVTNLRGGQLHTGDGGLLAAADAHTHADLSRMIERQYEERTR